MECCQTIPVDSWMACQLPRKNDNQKGMRCFVVEEFEQIVSSGGRYDKFLIFEPLCIHCIDHTRREGNGWFWDLASILGNRATSTWQPISLLFFQWSFVFENYICIEISCLSFKSPIFIYVYIHFNFWEFLSLHNDTNQVKYLFVVIFHSAIHIAWAWKLSGRESCQFFSHERELILKKLFCEVINYYCSTLRRKGEPGTSSSPHLILIYRRWEMIELMISSFSLLSYTSL